MTFGAFISAKRKDCEKPQSILVLHVGISVMLSRAVVPHQKVIL